jgi:hypothetical protein
MENIGFVSQDGLGFFLNAGDLMSLDEFVDGVPLPIA